MNNFIKKIGVGLATASLAVASVIVPAFAVTNVVVKPSDTQGWSAGSTNSGGDVDFVNDATAPSGSGALQLTTDATIAAKAQYKHSANTNLSAISELSYYTKQVAPSGTVAAPAYQLTTCLNGAPTSTTCPGFSTLVFEPYQNPTQGVIVNGQWQSWDVDQGLFWSTRTVTCSNGTITGAPGGPASYTLAQINTICPNAVVADFRVNIGSNNSNYIVLTDLVNFNGTIYDFEPNVKDDCKKDGYKSLKDGDGKSFKNQGQCVSYFNTL